MYKIDFTDRFKTDLLKLQKENSKYLSKILIFIVELSENPFVGSGKPEPLKHEYSGMWSRRITDKHRLVYEVKDEIVLLVKCYDHY